MKEQIPLLSVIMPFYNCEKFLDESISSILSQTFKDFEFIIINDASTDKSDYVIQKYLFDQRIKYVKNTRNIGITANLNNGIKMARAEIIARMDGDDVSEKDRLEKEYSFLLRNPDISFVGTFISIIDEDGKETDKRTKPIDPAEIKKAAIIYSPIIHATAMYKRSVVIELGGYRSEYGKAEDQDLWLRALYSGSYNFSNIPEFLYRYRYHTNSTAHDSRRNAVNDFRLRRDMARRFKINLNIEQKINILGQLAVGILCSGRQRQAVEGFYKRIVYGRK